MSEFTYVFSTRKYAYLQEEIISSNNFIKAEIVSTLFPDGEIYHKIITSIEGCNVLLIGGTIDDSNTLELYDLAHGIIQNGAKSLTVVIPYFGYSTMERAVLKGEIVKAKNRALLFSSLPACSEPNKVFLIDLHSEGIPYYFGSDIRCKHIYAKEIILNAAQEYYDNSFVLASTDAGRAKWVESLANEIGVKSAFVYKQRISGNETQITGVNASIEGENVIIYDDMIRTGGSLMQAANVYQNAGAKEIIAITTHGLFNNLALEKIEQQGILKKIICTNTHPNCYLQQSSLISIKSIATLIIKEITNR